ncbi:MAG: hypothetical protein RR064_00620 [Oscillospiraceae bacterium]
MFELIGFLIIMRIFIESAIVETIDDENKQNKSAYLEFNKLCTD